MAEIEISHKLSHLNDTCNITMCCVYSFLPNKQQQLFDCFSLFIKLEDVDLTTSSVD